MGAKHRIIESQSKEVWVHGPLDPFIATARTPPHEIQRTLSEHHQQVRAADITPIWR
jgi:hypothetical protein